MNAEYTPNFEFLDDEEREIEQLDPAMALSEEKRQEAQETFQKSADTNRKAVTMRLSKEVITGLKAKAEADGIPYQTLASMILQKYVRGALLDADAVKEVVKALNRYSA